MLKWIYLVNAFVSFYCFLVYFETTLNKANQKQLLLYVFANMANYGFALATFSKNLDGLYIAYQFYYIGCVFALITFFFVVIEICMYKAPKVLKHSLITYGIAIIVLLSTARISNLYYVSIDYAYKNGMAYLHRKYGPLHNMLPILIGGISVSSIAIAIRAFFTQKDVSRRTTRYILIVQAVATFFYFIPKFYSSDLEFLPFSFTIASIFMLMFFKHANLYDISSNLLNVYEQRNEYGYIALDLKKRYLAANDFAKKVFPDLQLYRIDEKLQQDDSILGQQILPWLDGWISGEKSVKSLTSENMSVICSARNIHINKKNLGYLIEIQDVTQHQKYIDLLNNYNSVLETEVSNKTKKITQIQDSIITGMATMVESRDNSTGGHIKRTSACVKVFVEGLKQSEEFANLGDSFCTAVIKAAPMHDLGKISVDDAILRKPGKFTAEEYEQMKNHSAEGAKIVQEVLSNVDDEEFKTIAINIAHFHHEKWNGTGYPTGISQKTIPLEARIMAFADVFDALVSKRCYKEAFDYDRAFEIIKNDLGTHFDPELGKTFLTCRPQLEALYNSFGD